MSKSSTQRDTTIFLKRATNADIATLIEIEKTTTDKNTYSAMTEEAEWQTELETSNVYLIEKDTVIVGDISFEQKDTNHIHISGIIIKPEFRGQGIAKEALQVILEKIGAVQRIDLVTHPDNHRAIELYKSFGFIIESRKENYFGDGEPRIVMGLKNK